MSGLARQVAAAEGHAKTMADSFWALEAADREVCKVLQECATRVFARDDKEPISYLEEHKSKRLALRQAFSESSRALEVVLQQAKLKNERSFAKSDVETEIDRLVLDIHSREGP